MSVWFISLLLQATLALPEVERLPEPSSAGSTGPNWVRGAPEPTLIWMERERDKTVILQESVWREGSWSPKTAQTQSNKAFVNWADFPQAAVSLQGNSLYATLELMDYPHLSYGVRLNTESGNTAWLHQDTSGVEHGFPSLVAHPAEGWLAIWLDGRGGSGHGHGSESERMSLMAARVTATGEALGEVVIDARACSCCSTDLAFTEDGAAWAVYRDRSDDEVRDIALVQIPANLGVEDGESAAVLESRIPVPDGWKVLGCPVNGPALAIEANQLAYCWFTMGKDGSQPQVRLAVSTDGGDTFGIPYRISSGRSLGRVDLEFVDADTLLVTWLESRSQGAAWMAKTLNVKTREFSQAMLVDSVSGSRSDGFLRLSKQQSDIYAAWLDDGIVRTARISNPRTLQE